LSTAPTTRVWDAPTRLFHWALVAALGASWWSAENDRLDIHYIAGHVALALLVFRLAWGLVGSDTARFGKFVKGPRAVLRYARSVGDEAGETAVGHNPLGGWSVLAMLAAIALQVGLGLFAIDTDGLESGSLADFVSYEAGRWAAETHETAFRVLQALVLLHVAAILFYAIYKRRDLVRPMITGRAAIASAEPLRFASAGRALLVALVAAALSWWVWNGLRL
jgi:cytochrome b